MGTNELHVRPVDDLIEHTTDADCPCGPRSEAVKRDDGSVGWTIVHHSLDGRELDEGEGLYRITDETGTDLPPPDVDWRTWEVPE